MWRSMGQYTAIWGGTGRGRGDIGGDKVVVTAAAVVALPESLGNLTRLKKLFVNKNDLTGVPNSLAMCMELKTVDLKGNPVPADELDRIQQMFGEGVKVKSD